MAYNQELCDQKHRSIEEDRHEDRQVIHDIVEILRGNGKPGLITRLDRVERRQDAADSLFWRVLTPALPLIYGAIAAALYCWIRSM